MARRNKSAQETSIQPGDVQVTVRGTFPAETVDYARHKVAALGDRVRNPVTFASVKLTKLGDPAVRHPVIAQANLDVDGRMVRAQVAAPTAVEAVDSLDATLRHRLERIAEHWEARRGRQPSRQDHEWRHGDPPEARPAYFPRPPEEREVIRHKAFTIARCGVDEAADEMAAMEYDFYLFTEAGSEQDSILYRTAEQGYRLAQVLPAPDALAPHGIAVTVSEQPAVMLDTGEAINRLNLSGMPFVFYLDAERDRGAVLYRRYDGHYGLITPAM